MPLRSFVIAVFVVMGAGNAFAQETWNASPLDRHSVPDSIVEETRKAAPHGLPDGLVETHDVGGDIAAAWYGVPTTRYRHGILGDAIEASRLTVRTRDRRMLFLNLPATEVFEDRYPRLADLNGDGTIEVVTIRSSLSFGASVAVYGLEADALVQRASTRFIGLAHRWLNIAGIAQFRGTRSKEIAFVETPHIGGTLYVYEYAEGGLKQVGSLGGFSNHVIGSTEMGLSAVADIDGDGVPELAVPSADRRHLRVVGFRNSILTERASVALPARIDKAIAVKGVGLKTGFIVGLENGQVYEIHR